MAARLTRVNFESTRSSRSSTGGSIMEAWRSGIRVSGLQVKRGPTRSGPARGPAAPFDYISHLPGGPLHVVVDHYVVGHAAALGHLLLAHRQAPGDALLVVAAAAQAVLLRRP